MKNMKQRAASTNENQDNKKKKTMIITESQLRRLIDRTVTQKIKSKEINKK
jgi:hypothetical protein